MIGILVTACPDPEGIRKLIRVWTISIAMEESHPGKFVKGMESPYTTVSIIWPDWKDAQLNVAKEILAYELTKLVHGEEEANKAQAAAKALFVGGGDDANMPTTEIPADKLTDGQIGILNLMVACKLASSNKEARRLVEQGGVFVNDEKVPAASFSVTEAQLKEGVKIRKGKKVFHKAVLA